MIAEQLLDGEAETITRKAIDDRAAIVFGSHCATAPRSVSASQNPGTELNCRSEPSDGRDYICGGAGCADPTQAADLSRVIETTMNAIEATEIERRLRVLEERSARDAK